MSRDTWNPEVDDTSVPLVGEWKYPVDRPSGPVVCSSRVVSVLGVEGLRKQTMRLGAGPDASQTGKPTQNATCFVHYDMWQANDTHQEVWSTRRESEAHQIVFGDASRVHEAFENATTMTNEAKRGSQGLKENNETSLQTNRPVPVPVHSKRKHHVGLDACLATMAPGERSLFRIPHQLAYGELGNFSFPSVPPACDLICDLELIGVKLAADEPVARVDMLYEERIERVKKLRLEGNALYRAGDFTSAQSQYEMALSFLTDDMLMQLHGRYLDEANSEKLPAHLNLSACFLHQQRYHECIDQASRALAMDSKNAKAFYRRGRARQVLGQDDDARSDLLNALKNAPGQEDAATLHALRDLETEQVKQARARKRTFGGLFGHENGTDGEESDSAGDAFSDDNDDDDEALKIEKMNARQKKVTRLAKRDRRVLEAEKKMDDVDEAGGNNEPGVVHPEPFLDNEGVFAKLFRRFGFGGK